MAVAWCVVDKKQRRCREPEVAGALRAASLLTGRADQRAGGLIDAPGVICLVFLFLLRKRGGVPVGPERIEALRYQRLKKVKKMVVNNNNSKSRKKAGECPASPKKKTGRDG